MPKGLLYGIRPAVRLPIIAFLVLCCSSLSLHAQQQERKLAERLSNWDMDLEYNTGQSSFRAPGSVNTSKATTKEFGGGRTFQSKEFSSKACGGTKQSWFASLFFSSNKSANTKGKYEVPNAGAKYDTKNAATKDAREGAKSMETRDYVPADQEYLKQGHRDRWGRSQSRLDQEKEAGKQGLTPLGYTGDLKPMTIDDVRELLNKNK